MGSYELEKSKNMRAYHELKHEILAKYHGQYIAIADGQLVVASPSFEEADLSVKDYSHRLVFPAGEEPEIGPLRVRSFKSERCLG